MVRLPLRANYDTASDAFFDLHQPEANCIANVAKRTHRKALQVYRLQLSG
jgi:hypothetical protein